MREGDMNDKKDNKNSIGTPESMFLRRTAKMFFPAIFLILILWSFSHPLHAGETDTSDLINCQMHEAACKQTLADCDVTLDIQPKPVKAMADLLFQVVIAGKEPASPPYIDLGMPGMKMGPNRVTMKPVGKNVFEGKGIIVRCPSGRRTWRAKVTIPGLGTAEFVFDVVY
jgi:hypothetical protein